MTLQGNTTTIMQITLTEKLKAKFAIILLSITLIALLMQTFFKKTYVIDTNSALTYSVRDDESQGGHSRVAVHVKDNKFIFQCTIGESDFAWPYCELSFHLFNSKRNQGLDFSKFTHASLWIEYTSEAKDGIRFQTRNYDPVYSKPGLERSLKFNVAEVHADFLTNPVTVPLKYLSVPTWWLEEFQVPLQKTLVELDDTRQIVIVTGSNIAPGDYTIEITRIALQGKYIADNTLYLMLLAMWVAAAVLYVLDKLRSARKEVHLSRRHQKDLESLVQLLNVTKHELEHKLTRDSLTGALNRDGVAKVFEYKQSHKEQDLSVIFIDIDHFKTINDTHGHNLGDKILIQFAQLLTQNTREGDVLARWGGEEFLLACPNTDLQHAVSIAEKLRNCVAQYKWQNNITITASFGVAQMQQELATEFIGRADEALYTAKALGRNRVVAAGSELEA
ncbi:putative diguanylate cyclase YdaM [Thalassocella blandensis]|nr:putative diguanylate cyclase YdaM [Thalassocella blandensis]